MQYKYSVPYLYTFISIYVIQSSMFVHVYRTTNLHQNQLVTAFLGAKNHETNITDHPSAILVGPPVFFMYFLFSPFTV